MRIVKESIIKKHSYENGEHTSYTEVIEQYHYDSEEERNKHAEQMIEKGFNDSGQVKENVGTIMNPKRVWFGSYYKYERSLLQITQQQRCNQYLVIQQCNGLESKSLLMMQQKNLMLII